MSLSFYNQLSRSVQPFTPLQEGIARVYTCGPTVYSTPHVGNWAAYIYWDVLVRLLSEYGYDVTRVMNVTDVGHLVSDADDGEDKLEKGARREGMSAWDIAKKYSAEFMDGMAQLSLREPTHISYATKFIDEQLELVRTLKNKGHTYQIGDGIYFDTSTFPRYADFAHLQLDKLQEGARVEVNSEKRNPSDFALWKFTPAGQTRDMQWPTPRDLTDDATEPMGFPGWHLECSAMALSLLGDTIDIHTGGIDHIPVHHTNEIAQSESATGVTFSNYWLHNNHLMVEGAKISKSAENGYSLAELHEQGIEPLDFKLYVLQSHYRNEGNITLDGLQAAKNRRLHWRSVAALRHQIHDTITDVSTTETHSTTGDLYAAAHALKERLAQDLDTPGALMVIDDIFSRLETQRLDALHRDALLQFLEMIDSLLGIELLTTTPDLSDEVKQLLIARARARDNKDYTASDELRDEIEAKGVLVRDTPSGQVWEYRG